MRSTIEHELETIISVNDEREAYRKLGEMLQQVLDDEDYQPLKLIDHQGEEVMLPALALAILRRVTEHLAQGEAVSIIPLNEQLTTQEAADLLNVSRPYLIKLVDQGVIPFSKVGTHRRLLANDVLNYKKTRDVERRRGLDQLTEASQAIGPYD